MRTLRPFLTCTQQDEMATAMTQRASSIKTSITMMTGIGARSDGWSGATGTATNLIQGGLCPLERPSAFSADVRLPRARIYRALYAMETMPNAGELLRQPLHPRRLQCV